MITVQFSRKSGRCTMTVDAAEFQEYLRSLGAEESGGEFRDQPRSRNRFIDPVVSRVEPNLLLSPQPATLNLADYYTTPPTLDQIRKLGESVQAVAQGVVEHYKPIEVAVRIYGKRGPVEVSAYTAPPKPPLPPGVELSQVTDTWITLKLPDDLLRECRHLDRYDRPIYGAASRSAAGPDRWPEQYGSEWVEGPPTTSSNHHNALSWTRLPDMSSTHWYLMHRDHARLLGVDP